MAKRDAILVTGAAGFIGFHLAQRLLADGHAVVGADSLNAYYDPALKQARLDVLGTHDNFRFVRCDLADRDAAAALFAERYPRVVHLAAQAGVRHSIDQPYAYADANLTGFLNVLEGCRRNACGHLVYASSSSVYGANTKVPFAVSDVTERPISLYAATKKANEAMAHAYSHLYDIPVTGLRFFTVYGPWGRPDMALFLFTRAILSDEPIKLFNHGRMRRDFTYIDDVVTALVRLIDHVPARGADHAAPARIYNVGNSRAEELNTLVAVLERTLGRTALKQMLPMQPGDVAETFADVGDLARDVGFAPSTRIEQGVARFVAWYREFYEV